MSHQSSNIDTFDPSISEFPVDFSDAAELQASNAGLSTPPVITSTLTNSVDFDNDVGFEADFADFEDTPEAISTPIITSSPAVPISSPMHQQIDQNISHIEHTHDELSIREPTSGSIDNNHINEALFGNEPRPDEIILKHDPYALDRIQNNFTQLNHAMDTFFGPDSIHHAEPTTSEQLVPALTADILDRQILYVRGSRSIVTCIDFPLIFWRSVNPDVEALYAAEFLTNGFDINVNADRVTLSPHFYQRTLSTQDMGTLVSSSEYHRSYTASPLLFKIRALDIDTSRNTHDIDDDDNDNEQEWAWPSRPDEEWSDFNS